MYSFPGSEGNKPITDLMPLKNSAELNARVAEWNKRKTELEQKVAQSKKALTNAYAKFAKLDSQPATQLAKGQINVREEQSFSLSLIHISEPTRPY